MIMNPPGSRTPALPPRTYTRSLRGAWSQGKPQYIKCLGRVGTWDVPGSSLGPENCGTENY